MLQAMSQALDACALGEQLDDVLEVRRRSMSTFSSSSLPASILEKSSRSLMMPSRFCPSAARSRRTCAACWSARFRSSSSVMPSTPFIGVRISWLMRARNELFAWFAASAASRAEAQRFLAALVLRDVARDGDPADALVELVGSGASATWMSIARPRR
jgi:hypothetical protein